MKKTLNFGMLGMFALAVVVGCASLTVTVDLYTGDGIDQSQLESQLESQVAAIAVSGICADGASDELLAQTLAEFDDWWAGEAEEDSEVGDSGAAGSTSGAAGSTPGAAGSTSGAAGSTPGAGESGNESGKKTEQTPAERAKLQAQARTIITKSWIPVSKKIEILCEVQKRAKDALSDRGKMSLDLISSEHRAAHERLESDLKQIADATDANLEVFFMEQLPSVFVATGIASNDNTMGRVAGFPVFDPNIKQILPTVSSEGAAINEESNWKTSNIVKAYAKGGNSQFVLVQQGLMTFHQKSLDFDPGSVISLAADATRMGLDIAQKVISATTGVSIPIGSGGGPTTSSPESSDTVDSATIDRIDSVIDGRERVIDRCLVDLATYLHGLPSPTASAPKVDLLKESENLRAMILKCQGDLDQEVRP